MAKEKKSKFKGKVRKNIEGKKKSNFDYLKTGNTPMYSPVEGRATLNMLSYIVKDKNHMDADPENEIATVGEYWYKKPFLVHKSVGIKNLNFICPRTFGKPCPMCEEQQRMRDDGASKEEIKTLYPQQRSLYIVDDTSNKEMKEDAYVWDVSDWKFYKPLEEEMEEDEKYEDFIDPEGKHSVRVRFKKDKFNDKEFIDVKKVDFVKRKSQFEENQFDSTPNLDKMLIETPYDVIRDTYFGVEDEETGDSKKKKKSKDKKKKEKEAEPKKKDKDKKEKSKDKKKDQGKSGGTQSSGSTKKLKCPHKHKFGKDHGDFDDCAECKLYKKCGKASV